MTRETLLSPFEGAHQSTTYTKPARATEETRPGCSDQMSSLYLLLERLFLHPKKTTYDLIEVWGQLRVILKPVYGATLRLLGEYVPLSTAAYNIYSLREIVRQGMLCEQADVVHSDAVPRLCFWPITPESRLRSRSTHP